MNARQSCVCDMFYFLSLWIICVYLEQRSDYKPTLRSWWRSSSLLALSSMKWTGEGERSRQHRSTSLHQDTDLSSTCSYQRAVWWTADQCIIRHDAAKHRVAEKLYKTKLTVCKRYFRRSKLNNYDKCRWRQRHEWSLGICN